MDNYNLINFCDRWLNKSKRYDLENLDDCFDKFFSLYVVYNALYVELRENVYKRKGGDEKSGIDYVAEYLTASNLLMEFTNDSNTHNAIEKLKEIISSRNFFITFDKDLKKFSRDKDIVLLNQLNSTEDNIKAKAILETIYRIRCNMFHGQKSLEDRQKDILFPLMIVLEKVINILYKKIKNEPHRKLKQR